MAKPTTAQRKTAATKKAEQTQPTPAQQAPAPAVSTTTSTAPAPAALSATLATGAIPSLIDQAMTFSMGAQADEANAQAALDLWNGMGCEALPPKLAVAVFDCAFKQGPQVCERLLGKVGITRDKGPFSLSAVEDRDTDDLVTDFLAWRLRRYAFTAAAATNMLEWSQHILALQALVIIEPETTPQA
jgi:lysozyme family protein